MNQMTLLAMAIMFSTSVLTVNAASTGTVNFKGRVTGSTCNVNVDGQGADATVMLPTVPATELASAGDTTGRTSFVMTLTDCSLHLTPPTDDDEGYWSESYVSAYFQAGATVDSNTGRLKQTTASGAENVSLQLRDGTNNNVIVAGSQTQRTNNYFADIDVNNQGEGIKLPYAVEYYAEDATTSGIVTSSVVYNLQYK